MPINEKNRLGQLGKRRLFLSVIFAASAGCIVWFTAHPPKQHAPESPVSESAETDTDAVPFYSLNLTAAARSFVYLCLLGNNYEKHNIQGV